MPDCRTELDHPRLDHQQRKAMMMQREQVEDFGQAGFDNLTEAFC
jgi:hypothetical protein